MKTARFSQVVARSGEPKVHDQWLAPAKDRALKTAVKEQRVMTVITHSVGSTKDHGEIGLVDARQRVLLVFPKNLRAFAGRRIVGINYDLLQKVPERAKKKVPVKTQPGAGHSKTRTSTSEAALRLFRPEEEAKKEEPEKAPPPHAKAPPRPRRQTKKARKAAPPSPPSAVKTTTHADRGLRAQVKKAMKQLQSGKAVQAYQTLEAALKG